MDLRNRRIHIAGSASATTSPTLLRYAHDLVAQLTNQLASRGAVFATGVGAEPLSDPADPASPAIIFDWTVIESAAVSAATHDLSVVCAVATSKTHGQIPPRRQDLWSRLCTENRAEVTYLPPGHHSGALRRAHLAESGDVLVLISGGEGVEHLAQAYIDAGKPVIPLDLDLGSSSSDGHGGAAAMAEHARSRPDVFFRVVEPSRAANLLEATFTRQGTVAVEAVVAGIMRLVDALERPRIFYVRLLNRQHRRFAAVERFFREVVDPTVAAQGYRGLDLGIEPNEYAWMNEEVFDSLHHSAGAIVDLTGLRPNCLIELGYALRGLRLVLVSCSTSDSMPFDIQPYRRFEWDLRRRTAKLREQFTDHWRDNAGRPPLVRRRVAP
jgi:hypothetical protein